MPSIEVWNNGGQLLHRLIACISAKFLQYHCHQQRTATPARHCPLHVSPAGQLLATAKAVCESANGGTIAVSESAYRQIGMEALHEQLVLMHGGRHTLHDGLPPCNLYEVCDRVVSKGAAHNTAACHAYNQPA
jgi:hypothetical protein